MTIQATGTEHGVPNHDERARILVAVHARCNLSALRVVLEDPEYEVVEASSTDEVFRQLAARSFAVVLLDARLIEAGTADVAGRLCGDERFGRASLILIYEEGSDGARVEEGYALGAVDVVTERAPAAARAKVRALVALFRERERTRREVEQLRAKVESLEGRLASLLETTSGVDAARGAAGDRDAGTIVGRRAERTSGLRQARLGMTNALMFGTTATDGMGSVLSAICDNLGWDVGTLWILNEEGSELECRASRHAPDARLSRFIEACRGRTFRMGEGLPGRVWATREPVWIVDVGQDANFPRARPAVEAGLRSAIAVPVLLNERFIGVIEFFTSRAESPDPELRELMSTVAGAVGQFLERQRAEERLREQTAHAETLLRLSGLLSQERELERLVQLVTDEGTRLCGAQLGAFFYNVTGAKGESYLLYSVSGVPRGTFEGFPMPRNTEVFGPTFRGEGVVRLHDVTKDPRYGKNAPHHGLPEGHLPVRSYLAVPVVSRTGEVLGALFLGHAEPGVFTAQHERLMVGIASQAAVAVDNARLHKRTQAAADRLNLALTAAHLGDWSWDAATDVVTFSERGAAIFGVPPGPSVTWTALQKLIHEPDRERARGEVERVVAERVQYDIEYRVNRADGTRVWVGALGRAIFDSADRVAGMFGVVQDVTEKKRLEESLANSEARFRGLMEQAPFSIQVLAPDGRTVGVNRAWEELWGVRLEQLDGYNLLEDRQLEAKGVLPFIRKAFAGEPMFIPEIPYDPEETLPGRTRHERPLRWVAAVAYPLKDEAGAVREVVLVHEDVTARRLAEAALRESEEKLRLLIDTIPQLAWMAGPDGHIVWYNRRWYEYTGTTPEQMEGWGWQSVHDPAVLPEVLERWKRSLATGEPFDMVFPLRGADGVLRPFLTRVAPLRDERGRTLYWFGTNTDVTELRQAREALAHSEERLRLALDAGRMGVWDWNVRTGDLRWSDSLEPLYGLQPGTFEGTFEHFQRLLHPDDRLSVNDAVRRALETGGSFYVEFRNVKPDGAMNWIAWSGKVFTGDDGKPSRMIGIGLDVTARRRTEQTARFLADASAALAVLVDSDTTLQKVADLAVPRFADWVTVDALEENGELRRVAVAHVDASKVQLAHEVHRRFPPARDATSGVWNVLRTGRPELVPTIDDDLLVRSIENAELLAITRRLGLRSYIGVPLVVRGRTMGVMAFIVAESGHTYDEMDLAVAEDLASRAAIAIDNSLLYRELREADRRKDEFLATLAHELRNPLAPIRNGLEIVRRAGGGGTKAEEARSMMERQLGHMVRLVDDLLDVSRITRNKLELRREPVTLEAVIDAAVETSRPMIERFGHSFTVKLPPEPVSLDGDPVRLAQVFSNLLNNAAKYTDRGGRIELVADVLGSELVVRVRDDGVGIPLEVQGRIFQLFSQVEGTKGRAQGGLGIGLTLVRRLTEMHGGTVAVTSEGAGKGSEFVVRLPVTDRTPRSALGTPRDVMSAPRRRILVVDDNADAAETMALMLELMGHEVRTAGDGLAAVESARSMRPEVIFLDIGLPKLDGYEACRRIREEAWSASVVIAALTGWGQEEDRRRSREAGFDHHLVKPVNQDQLAELLARAVP